MAVVWGRGREADKSSFAVGRLRQRGGAKMKVLRTIKANVT